MSLFQSFATSDSTVSVRGKSIPQIMSEARTSFETVLRIYYLRHGFETYDPMIMFWMVMLDYIAIKEVQAASSNSLRSTLVLMTKGLSDQGKNYNLAEGVLQPICAALNPEDLALCQRFTTIGAARPAQVKPNIITNWPIDIFSFADDPEPKRSWVLVGEGSSEGGTTDGESVIEG
jgi:hypothetical protein